MGTNYDAIKFPKTDGTKESAFCQDKKLAA